MSTKCTGCGDRTKAMGSFCRSCRSQLRAARKRVEADGLIVDAAGGAWWVWTSQGDVLVIGAKTKQAALLDIVLAETESVETVDNA